MKIQLKFDVITICNNFVSQKLDALDIAYTINAFGEVEILEPLNNQQKDEVIHSLNSSGIEVVSSEQMIIVQKIKDCIGALLRQENFDDNRNLSEYLQENLPYSYDSLSRIFSEFTHMGIEKFYILKKIDYVKELLTEHNLTLTQIAYKLDYSSVSHLSKQFKKTTGFSPSRFVELKGKMSSRRDLSVKD